MLVVSHLCGDTVLTLHVACREAINQMSDFTNTGALNFLLCSSTSSSFGIVLHSWLSIVTLITLTQMLQNTLKILGIYFLKLFEIVIVLGTKPTSYNPPSTIFFEIYVFLKSVFKNEFRIYSYNHFKKYLE